MKSKKATCYIIGSILFQNIYKAINIHHWRDSSRGEWSGAYQQRANGSGLRGTQNSLHKRYIFPVWWDPTNVFEAL